MESQSTLQTFDVQSYNNKIDYIINKNAEMRTQAPKNLNTIMNDLNKLSQVMDQLEHSKSHRYDLKLPDSIGIRKEVKQVPKQRRNFNGQTVAEYVEPRDHTEVKQKLHQLTEIHKLLHKRFERA